MKPSISKNLLNHLRGLSKIHLTLIVCLLIISQLEFDNANGFGEPCGVDLICKENEVCQMNSQNVGVCRCLPGFSPLPNNKTCSAVKPDPAPDEGPGSTLGLGLTITTVLVFFLCVSVGYLQYRYHILNGVLHSIYRFRRRPSRGGQTYEVADDGDDVNPIV